jgi:WD40 repeat protein
MIAIKTDGVTPDRIAFSPDGALVAASSTGLVLSVYDALAGKLKWRTLPRPNDQRTGLVEFSPDGRAVCLAWEPGEVYDAETGRRLPGAATWPVLKLTTGVAGRARSADGRWSTDGMTTALHDAETNRTVEFFPRRGLGAGEKSPFPLHCIFPLAFSPDGSLFAGSDNTRLHVFRCEELIALAEDAPPLRAVATLKSVRKFFQAAVFAPRGDGLLTGTNDGLVRVWDTATWQERAVYDWKCGPIRWLAITTDGSRAAVAGTRKIVVWDLDE